MPAAAVRRRRCRALASPWQRPLSRCQPRSRRCRQPHRWAAIATRPMSMRLDPSHCWLCLQAAPGLDLWVELRAPAIACQVGHRDLPGAPVLSLPAVVHAHCFAASGPAPGCRACSRATTGAAASPTWQLRAGLCPVPCRLLPSPSQPLLRRAPCAQGQRAAAAVQGRGLHLCQPVHGGEVPRKVGRRKCNAPRSTQPWAGKPARCWLQSLRAAAVVQGLGASCHRLSARSGPRPAWPALCGARRWC